MNDTYKIDKINFDYKTLYISYFSDSIKNKNEKTLEIKCDQSENIDEYVSSIVQKKIDEDIEEEKNQIEELRKFFKEYKTIPFRFKKSDSSDTFTNNEPDIEIEIYSYSEIDDIVYIRPYCSKFKHSRDHYKIMMFHIYDFLNPFNFDIVNDLFKKCENVIYEYLNIEKSFTNKNKIMFIDNDHSFEEKEINFIN
jgi:hypothetical protein